MIGTKEDAYLAAYTLMKESPAHQGMGRKDFDRLVKTPIMLGQYVAGFDPRGVPYLFATYAFPEPHHIERYYRKLDFPKAGFRGQGDTPYVIDFICMTGKRDIIHSFRYIKSMFTNMGYSEARWLRVGSSKQSWHSWQGD